MASDLLNHGHTPSVSESMRPFSSLMLGSLIISTALHAQVREYRADMHESQWISQTDKLGCELQHPIPRFGTARFFRSAGNSLQFQLAALHASHVTREAMLDSVAPEWKHPHEERQLTPLKDSGSNTPFRLLRSDALRLIYELERGMRPTFIYPDAANGDESLHVGLSPVNFRDAIGDFRQCMAALLPFGFDAIQFTRVLFETDSNQLSDLDKVELDRIARYQPLDRQVKKIVVKGHADWVDTERYNLDLSEFRTYAVVDYLVERGIPEAIIEARFFGESEPVGNNRTKDGRARNRRVSVEVIREPEPETADAAASAE